VIAGRLHDLQDLVGDERLKINADFQNIGMPLLGY